MVTLEDVRRMATAGESEIVEFKRSTAEAGTGARTVCAMLNGERGGFVIFGVTNDGNIVGQEIGEQTHDRIRAEIRKIDPPAFPDLQTIPVDEHRSALVLTVTGGSGLYRYDHRPYERFGATTTVMSEAEYQRRVVELLHGITRWENRHSPMGIDDLDHQELAVTVSEAVRIGRLREPGSREIIPMLNGLQLIKDGHILHAAVVLFGRSDRMFATYPQCGVRMARFRGTDKTEFVDNRQFYGNAFEIFQHAQQFFIEHLPIAGRIEGFYRIDTPKYPPDAFREALVNAICHRDYSIAGGAIDLAIYDDRLEIVSTGGLHFGLTVDQLKGDHQSRPWNPLVAQAFYLRGIIEKWGRGTNRMIDWTLDAGLASPELIDSGHDFRVRFAAAPALSQPLPVPRELPSDLTQVQQDVWNALDRLGTVPLREIRAELADSYSEDQIQRALQALRKNGHARRTGATRSSKWSSIVPTEVSN